MDATDRPLPVVNGDATPEEVAALLVVLGSVAAAGARPPEQRRPRSEWSAPDRRMGGPPAVPSARAGGWRASALPR